MEKIEMLKNAEKFLGNYCNAIGACGSCALFCEGTCYRALIQDAIAEEGGLTPQQVMEECVLNRQ